ncbi:MAG: acetyl-CoA carboxylase, carboxyltransferase subunit beta [Candidatus Latescibacteria bacterium]|nr:acetyl-CoA carboxylase, carboxyltransferase subunit beta [Candidatus Latescibacterota bacterium]
MNWFERMKKGFKKGRGRREIPEGIWSKCKVCSHTSYQIALERSGWLCSECGYHFPINHGQYADLLIDADTFVELDADIATADPLKFKGHKRYGDSIRAGRKASNMKEAVYTGIGRIGGHSVALGIMDTSYIMGTLGGATGIKIARLIERAIEDRRTLVLVCQSGGARMQESAYSLMQMAKISAKLHQLANAGLLYITVLTDPTLGGVTASFAMLGDVILAEPGARVGFAGPPVIKQFLGTDELPENFQLAETVLEHGFIDRIVPRPELALTLARFMALLVPEGAESKPSR